MSADALSVSVEEGGARPAEDQRAGASTDRVDAEGRSGFEFSSGVHPRYIDAATMRLDVAAAEWRRLQENRKRFAQYQLDQTCPACRDGVVLPSKAHKDFCVVASLALAEGRAVVRLSRLLRQHPLWPWLERFPGLGGGHTALVIGRIGDPRRFPGQRCSEGHYLPAGIYPVGSPCPVADYASEGDRPGGGGADLARADEGARENEPLRVCPGVLLDPRPGTGTRSVWHYLGVACADDGRLMRRRKGGQASWNPEARTSILMPDSGIAAQIVRQRVPVYAEMYESKKERLKERIPEGEGARVGDLDCGDANGGPTVDAPGRPLRPFEADRIARVYAAKQFLADMLAEWKAILLDS